VDLSPAFEYEIVHFAKVFVYVMSLELHRRYEIVFQAKHNDGPKFGINQIAKLIKCNRSTVIRWLKRWDETKDLSDREKTGRPRTTTRQQDEIMIDLVREDIDEGLTSEKIHGQLMNENINVSDRTVRRRLSEAGFKYMKPLSKPLLTERHQRKRLSWARSFISFDWNRVIASDETVFRLHDVKRFYWQRPGERKVCRKVPYSIKINARGCFSSTGFGRIFCFKENMNSIFLCNNIYKNVLLPSTHELFGRNRNWLLLEDNDPKHRSRYSMKWKDDHHIETLLWPSLSPDMNPVENVWGLLKIKVADRRPTTTEELIRTIKEEWRRLPQELAANLMTGMSRRIDCLIDAKGDYTMY
jgi:transposase